ncbi:hypothetical protein QFZ22_000797 [Streptomyces canus]|uniref:Uncharacterized protein n=1 Tax=Streptomyces canus TaxID=58343 RepID=A0AAW8F4N3_9ACTN|nr:hypothetical protein [Streptomyces canus]MDQ0904812.1 hypothetical protein [Streptomyces canus]
MPRNAPGRGRWDDFAYHPKDGRLSSVEGDNGDLLLVDPSRQPMKTVLKKGAFPPAEASATAGSRKSYSATFFDQGRQLLRGRLRRQRQSPRPDHGYDPRPLAAHRTGKGARRRP